MFGDKPIIGLDSEKRLDSHNRFIIPRSCNAEQGEDLIIYKEDDFFSIYAESCFLDQINREQLENIRDFLESKKRKEEIAKKIGGRVTVDVQGRITIPKHLLKEYEMGKEISVEGAIDHINVYKRKK